MILDPLLITLIILLIGFYGVSLLVLGRRGGWFIVWLGLELLTLAFLLTYIRACYSHSPVESIIKYFLIQRLRSFIFLCAVSLARPEEVTGIFTLLFVALLKIGLPPFQRWALDFVKALRRILLFLFLRVQKLRGYYLIFLLQLNLIGKTVAVILTVALILAVGKAIFTNALVELLFFSSIRHSLWIIVGLVQGNFIFFCYFFVYTIILYPLIVEIEHDNILILPGIIQQSILLTLLFLVFLGLPPFQGFILKWFVTTTILDTIKGLAMLWFFLSLLPIIFYFRVVYLTFFWNSRAAWGRIGIFIKILTWLGFFLAFIFITYALFF